MEVLISDKIKANLLCTKAAKSKAIGVYNWKVIKKNGDKLYVKWKGYDNSFKVNDVE